MVKFDVKVDMKGVEKMLNKYPQRAVKEYTQAVKNTVIHGYRIAPERTPGSGALKKSWKWKMKGLSGSFYNTRDYAGYVNEGWKRTGPIVPKKPGGILVFKTKDWKGSQRPSALTMLKKRSRAMKKLAGKGFSQEQKNQIVNYETGVAIARRIDTPAHFKGYHFIQKRIFPSVQNRFDLEMKLANRRIFN